MGSESTPVYVRIPKGATVYSTHPSYPRDGRAAGRTQVVRLQGWFAEQVSWVGRSCYWMRADIHDVSLLGEAKQPVSGPWIATFSAYRFRSVLEYCLRCGEGGGRLATSFCDIRVGDNLIGEVGALRLDADSPVYVTRQSQPSPGCNVGQVVCLARVDGRSRTVILECDKAHFRRVCGLAEFDLTSRPGTIQ